MNKSNQRAKIIKEIMKYKKYSNGITLQELYKLIEAHPQYNEVFGAANINNPKQYQHSTRALLQHRAKFSKHWEHKFKDFLNVGTHSGIWTYYDNPKFTKLIEACEELSKKIKDIDKLHLNTKEKTAIIKIRLNQTSFRNNLLLEMESNEQGSPFKNVDKASLLIASHIVDHCDCKFIEEQANYFNGLILTPDVDKLFDRKYISFNEEGKIITKDIDINTLRKMGIDTSSRLPKYLLTEPRKEFLKKRNSLYKFSK